MLVVVRESHRFPLPFFLTNFRNQNENLKNYVKIERKGNSPPFFPHKNHISACCVGIYVVATITCLASKTIL